MALVNHSQQNNKKEGEDLSWQGQFFLPSASCVYLCIFAVDSC